jgi:hypothetical protein
MAKERDRSKATPAPKRDDGTQLERVRGICLSIPNAIEEISHGATRLMPAASFGRISSRGVPPIRTQGRDAS